MNGSNSTARMEPETEVVAKVKRRRFTAEYKRKVLREIDRCTQPGEVGALLRREGLYWSNVRTWRLQQERGELTGLAPKKRGPRGRRTAEERRRVEQEREIGRWKARAERAEALVELQKKVSELLGIKLPESDERD